MGYDNRRTLHAVTFALNATTSSSKILGQLAVVGVLTSAEYTTGDITFQNSHSVSDPASEPSDFCDVLKQDGTTAAGKITGAAQGKEYVVEGLSELATLNRVRLKCSVAQGAARTVWLICRELS